MTTRKHSLLDHLIINVDQGMRTVFGQPVPTERNIPGQNLPEADLNEQEKRLSAALMRINHAGEVSAQALYQGQALTAKSDNVRRKMRRAADEENDHLLWCESRVKAMNSHVSYLNPLWYSGSLAIGMLAGATGDKWSLGFVAETEKQVVKHIDEHLEQLPKQDEKTHAVLIQMREDEAKHAKMALDAGGEILPLPVRMTMKQVAKVMTKTAFWF